MHDGACMLQVLVILFLNPANSDAHKSARDMIEALARVLFSLKSKARHLLTLWLSQLPPDVLGGRCIRPLQRHLTTYIEVSYPPPFALPSVMAIRCAPRNPPLHACMHGCTHARLIDCAGQRCISQPHSCQTIAYCGPALAVRMPDGAAQSVARGRLDRVHQTPLPHTAVHVRLPCPRQRLPGPGSAAQGCAQV